MSDSDLSSRLFYFRDSLKLTELTLNGHYDSLPDELSQLSQLSSLTLSSIEFEVSNSIAKLEKLEKLRLYGSFSNLPNLKKMTQIKYIKVNAALTSIPTWIFHLPELETLDLQSNNISEIPPEILHSRKLNRLLISGNPIVKPAPEILGSQVDVDLVSIRAFFFGLQSGEGDELYEAKILILGEGGAGKTSLAKKIINSSYQLESQEITTEGIDIMRWTFDLNRKTQFLTNIWDFGGQEIYHSTHQFFLTERSLYIVVADQRREDTDFNYWLNVVELLGKDSPVIIVKNEKQGRSPQINTEELRSRFSNIKDLISTDLSTNRGLEQIRSEIQHQLLKLPHIGERLPHYWVQIRRELELDSRNHIPIGEYREICSQFQMDRKATQDALLRIFHDLGVCLHWQDDNILRDTVILKPEWGTTAVYAVLDDKVVKQKSGYFTRKHLPNIWSDSQYNDMHDKLLRLMMKFQLCYEIPGLEDNFVIPQMLSYEQPAYNWETKDNLIIYYKYEFMPKGILTRLIIAMHNYIVHGDYRKDGKRDFVWKSGVIFSADNTHAEVTEQYLSDTICIRVGGYFPENMMALVMHEIDKIHATFHNLMYDRYVICNCYSCSKDEKPFLFPYEILKRSIEKSSGEVQCQKSFDMIDAYDLLYKQLPLKRLQEKKKQYLIRNHYYVENIHNNFNEIDIETVRGGIIGIGNQQRFADDVNVTFNNDSNLP